MTLHTESLGVRPVSDNPMDSGRRSLPHTVDQSVHRYTMRRDISWLRPVISLLDYFLEQIDCSHDCSQDWADGRLACRI